MEPWGAFRCGTEDGICASSCHPRATLCHGPFQGFERFLEAAIAIAETGSSVVGPGLPTAPSTVQTAVASPPKQQVMEPLVPKAKEAASASIDDCSPKAPGSGSVGGSVGLSGFLPESPVARVAIGAAAVAAAVTIAVRLARK